MTDGMTEDDVRELEEVGLRETTRAFMLGSLEWPMRVLMVKRDTAEGIETGWVEPSVRRSVREAPPVVRSQGPGTTARTYASLEQMLDAGWRVD